MATIKSYTDLSQSKTLSKILPLESADMCYLKREINNTFIETPIIKPIGGVEKSLCCWSLAALLGVLPTMIGSIFEKDALRLRIDKSETDFNIWYDNIDTGMVEEGLDIIKTNSVDACYEMIIKLHELNLL